MTELHSQIGTFSDLFDKIFHTASEQAESTYKNLLFTTQKETQNPLLFIEGNLFSSDRITNNVSISTWFYTSDTCFREPSLKPLSGCICRRLSEEAQMFG